MKTPVRNCFWLVCVGLAVAPDCFSTEFDAAPFGRMFPDGAGIIWDDPREVHRVVVQFSEAPASNANLRLEYWGSHWPEQHLPKDRAPGGGDVGWMELGNWFQGGWRVADAQVQHDGAIVTFTFRPVNETEFPKLTDYPARFRYTLKLRIASANTLPKVIHLQAFTDSSIERRSLRLAWKNALSAKPRLEAFNGAVENQHTSGRLTTVTLADTVNPDPNTFDRTLLTVSNGKARFTLKVDDLANGALFLPEFGVAALSADDARDYAAVAAQQNPKAGDSVYDRVAKMPEQTWSNAWAGMPPKSRAINFPLGLDGGRERFLLEPDGSVLFRSNDHYLKGRPGKDTPRLALEPDQVHFWFGPPLAMASRTIEEDALPICRTAWRVHDVDVAQTAFATSLDGLPADGHPQPSDTFAVFLARFTLTNRSEITQTVALEVTQRCSETIKSLRVDPAGFLWEDELLRGQTLADAPSSTTNVTPRWTWVLAPGQTGELLVKLPYVVLRGEDEREKLSRLDFDVEHAAVARYWRSRLDQSARLITPEPVLNDFYRAVTGHLLINCEGEPGAPWRFARVGSFVYGVYGNESAMMVADLERRGFHHEAQQCLDAWLHYQGTVPLPGDFDSQTGILYGAGGYEAGGYNQHHGWILWSLAEHYRFTRDRDWLRHAGPGILAAADWIIGQTARTNDRHDLAHGLLPPGGLEDIGDWWTWLSTSCYTWRGLDSAAWALRELGHPQAARVQRAADAFHEQLLANFRAAAQRSPVVRLRDGTAVPHFPSCVQRRGRSFGWICETLEGAQHLLITRALDPQSPEATWIIKDYEDNLYLSDQYGYHVDDFDKYWFGRGGMSMQACLLLQVEPYLYRDDVKQALRALFNSLAAVHFPDVHLNAEHALPNLGDWRGDLYKTSDEANACGWLRQLFFRENGNDLLVGQAIPCDWLKPTQTCGLQRAETYFGTASVLYAGGVNQITARLEAPRRNLPQLIRLRFRTPGQRPLRSVVVNGRAWKKFTNDWVLLPGDMGTATVDARF